MKKPLIAVGSDVSARDEKARERIFAPIGYCEAIVRAGGMPVIVSPQPDSILDVLGRVDGLVLPGGADCDPAVYGEERHPTVHPMDPRRQANDLALARTARQLRLPTLGICLGMQLMNVVAGGSLIQHIDETAGGIRHASRPGERERHDVTVEPDTLIASIIGAGRLNVNSTHHQAVNRLGRDLRITSRADDGIIESIEDPSEPFCLGVQWHPEDMPGEESAEALFSAFIEAAARQAAARR